MNLINLWKSIEEFKGASYNISTGELNPKEGYMVSMLGDQYTYPAPSSLEEFKTVVNTFLYGEKKMEDLSNKENAFLGFWIDNNILYIDICEQVHNKSVAIMRGIGNFQQAIYDNANKEAIWL